MSDSELLRKAIEDIRGKRVLVAPLNWGLGHATRCVPIIHALLAANKTVVIAADGYPLAFLRDEFPTLEWVEFKGALIEYSPKESQVTALLKQLPALLRSIRQEHRILKQLVAKYQINTVISDNRFGLWHRRIPSIYITHQLMIKMPPRLRFLEPIAHQLHGWFVGRYSTCWVPDNPGNDNLSGDLAHHYSLPYHARFVGTLSRFQNLAIVPQPSPYKHIAILSGIEPQRSLYEEKLIARLQQENEPALIVQGKPQEQVIQHQIGQITILSHLPSERLGQLLLSTKNIYCRSGYSMLMDLVALQRTAILTPTPGQTEQEYLAQYVTKMGFSFIPQSEL